MPRPIDRSPLGRQRARMRELEGVIALTRGTHFNSDDDGLGALRLRQIGVAACRDQLASVRRRYDDVRFAVAAYGAEACFRRPSDGALPGNPSLCRGAQ